MRVVTSVDIIAAIILVYTQAWPLITDFDASSIKMSAMMVDGLVSFHMEECSSAYLVVYVAHK